MHAPGVHNDKSQSITMWETAGKFFDELVESIEISLPKLKFTSTTKLFFYVK